MVKLIGVDIDGTIARKNKIHPTTIKAINYASQLNIPVVIATGRSITKIKPIAKQLGISDLGHHFVSLNGGLIFRFLNNNDLMIDYKKPFTSLQAKKIFSAAKKLKINFFAYTDNENVAYCSQKLGFFKFSMKVWSKKKQVINYKKLSEQLPVMKFLCFGNQEKIEQLEALIENDNFSIFDFSYKTTTRSNVEINPPGINKSEGLKFVCSELKIDAKDIIYFGDGHNDLGAIKFAGTGVAMKNANPNIKDVADIVTDLPVEEGGVGDFLFKNVFK